MSDIPQCETLRRWLIEGLWGAAAVGLVGGAPKVCKSWLGLDIAVSVSSGTPCLGRFTVLERGRALVYLAEDCLDVVRERVASIARCRGLALDDLDLHVITTNRLRLDDLKDRSRLTNTVKELRPKLLVLDPLVRLHGVNENDATEIAELLSYLRELQRSFDLAILVVHHSKKNSPSGIQAGQGLRGSGDLHAFGDSNLYLRRTHGELVLTMEHRAAAAPEPVSLKLVTDSEQTIHLEVVGPAGTSTSDGSRESLDDAVLRLLRASPQIGREELRRELGVKNERLGQALARLAHTGLIERASRGWRTIAADSPTAPVPSPS